MANDTMMRDSSMACLACGTRVIGPYCYYCGQKNDDCRRSIFRLAAETLTDTAALDGRFARTARQTLTRPGSHVRQYADGRRSPFTPPIRYFLVVSFLFFTTLWLTDRHLLVIQPIVLDEAIEEQPIEIDPALSDIDAAAAVLSELEAADGVPKLDFYGGFLMEAKDMSYTEEQIAWFEQRLSDSVFEFNGTTLSGPRFTNAVLGTAQNPAAFNNALNGWIPRLMILFIPFMALLGTIFIRGRDALIYDHLLLSIQTHAFGFVVMTLSLWTSRFLPPEVGPTAFFLGVPFYYLMGLRGAFKRSWRKSIVATVFVTVVYGITYTIALLVAGVASFVEIV
ncbi:MAG: DUF3667 domain-containing protein [Pseudomonadota bacterium]